MSGQYEQAISIKQAIDAINNRKFLLPAIQRKFVWSSHQICMLFDSIMCDYPINTFMFWEIEKDEIKNQYKFYEFLKAYCERFNEENLHIVTNAGFHDFKAVIDGQQRLTSLYIGLCGTYAYKQPRAWWPNYIDPKVLPPRKLYIDLLKKLIPDSEDSLMKYNFKFLTDKQYNDAINNTNSVQHCWFCINEILKFAQYKNQNDVLLKVVQPEVNRLGLKDNEFARQTLLKLYDVVRNQPIIHYFNEKSQDIDHVLDVFIRTNSGGTKLDFADLLMSIAVANWDGDFRREVDDLLDEINQSTVMGFYIRRDWILKVCLMLTDLDIKFKVKNFKKEQVEVIQSNWFRIKDCIRQTFILIRRFGINAQSLTSKNAVIPICYYLYKKQYKHTQLYTDINTLSRHGEERDNISRWLYMALLKGIFGGHADTILNSMRDILRENIEKPIFPLEQVIDRYKTTNKDLRFDEEYLDCLLDIQHGEGRCRAVLHLLFPEMNPTEIFQIDHLHPKEEFKIKNLHKYPSIAANNKLLEFYKDPKHWNSIVNLHLLNDSQNRDKSNRMLCEWLSDLNVNLTASSLLIDGVDLRFESFEMFYKKRREVLRERLKKRVFMTNLLPTEPSSEDSDEEVVDEGDTL